MSTFPFEPLEAIARVRILAGANEDTWFAWSFPTVADVTAGHLAELFGVSMATIHRWRRCGLGWAKADRAAATIGETPWTIWPEMWGQDDAA